MSTIYEDSFWKGYDIIHEHYMKRKNQFIQLNFIFSRLSVLYESFGEGLTELVDDINFYEPTNQKDTSTFDNFMDEFISQLKELGAVYKDVSNDIKKTFVDNILGLNGEKEIYFTDNLNEMVPNQEKVDRNITFPDIEADFISELNILEEKKINFHHSINQQIKSQIGKGKFLGMFPKKNKSDFIPDEKTNEYMKKLKEVEQKRKKYVNYYKTLTNYYYNTEVKFIAQTKTIMKTYTNNINPLYEKLGSIIKETSFIDNIDSKKDTELFVKEKKTLGFPPFQLNIMTNIVEAENIIKELGLKESEKQEKMNIIKEFEENVISHFSQLNDNTKQLEPYFTKLNEGQFTDELLEQLKEEFSKEDSGQKNEEEEGKSHKGKVHNYGSGLYENMGIKNIISFLNLYNTKRIKNNELMHQSFNYLVNIFNFIITKTQKIDDFELRNKILGWCITLSQTFKCIIDGKEKYIQEGIENNEVFKNADSWKSLSHYYIAENVNQSNNYTNFKTKLDEQDLISLQKIVSGKGLSIIFNMNELNVPKKIIDVVANDLVNTYGVDIPYVNEIRKTNNKEEPKMIE